jgi:hypothetical protein
MLIHILYVTIQFYLIIEKMITTGILLTLFVLWILSFFQKTKTKKNAKQNSESRKENT